MKIRTVTFLVALGVIAASFLSAQETPPSVYYGPYQEVSNEQFEGEWTRSDGTYRMVISVEEGTVKAEYFNPKPIHVESSTTEQVEDGIGLTIVLRDVGYDGSTYRLQYVPQYRLLIGTYTIPGQEPGEVYFTK